MKGALGGGLGSAERVGPGGAVGVARGDGLAGRDALRLGLGCAVGLAEGDGLPGGWARLIDR